MISKNEDETFKDVQKAARKFSNRLYDIGSIASGVVKDGKLRTSEVILEVERLKEELIEKFKVIEDIYRGKK